MTAQPGWIVVLNGAPRAGKSSIAQAMQESLDGVWMNLGVDVHVRGVTPQRHQPGIGLRPGGERPDLEPLVPVLYAALYDSVAAHSRLGLNVVVDVGHHDGHATVSGILADCARRLDGLPALLVGVRCPIEEIMRRRASGQVGREGQYVVGAPEDPIPEPVRRWQTMVHHPGVYDLEVDTSLLSPAESAKLIGERLASGLPYPTAFQHLAGAE